MKFLFYITNHGFGHASRNVPVINELLKRDEQSRVIIKSDPARCDFLKRNFGDNSRITFYDDCFENGLILRSGTMEPDVKTMKTVIEDDFNHWDEYISREVEFLSIEKPDRVVADTICWGIKAANVCGIKTVLITNFIWSQMYKSFFDKDIWGRYEEYYKLADKAIWYRIHEAELDELLENSYQVGLVSRPVDAYTVESIKSVHKNPIVFVSLGGSAEIDEAIDVSGLPYDFLTTRGLNLVGDNVYPLPIDMINTPDYIAASEFVIAKGGWSTVAEILLQGKKSALLLRGQNKEDQETKRVLDAQKHAVVIDGSDIKDIGCIIDRIKTLKDIKVGDYVNDLERICDLIISE